MTSCPKWIILLVFPSFGWAQPAVDQILKEVAAKCQDLYTSAYAVDIDHHRTEQRRVETGNGDRPRMPGPNDGMVDQIVLGRSGKSLHFEILNSAGEDWRWTTNGKTTWCYRRDLKAYTESKAEPWPQRLGPGQGLPGYEWKYFTKFLAIGGMSDRARLISDDIAPDASCPGPSVLIELTLGDHDSPATERLRILSKDHLPCHLTGHFVRWAGAMAYDFEENITWRFRDQVDPNLFIFAPAKQDSRVSRFPRH